MDMHSKKQYLQALQKEYLGASKMTKVRLLDEAEKRTNLNRKYLIRRLSAKTRWEKQPGKYRREKVYGVDLIEPLVRIWDIFDEPCGERLVVLLRDEVDRLRRLGELYVSDDQTEKLKKISAKTINRLLEHEKATRMIAAKYEKKKKPLLYEKIPTKMSHEWENILGQIQMDAVEHCGQTLFGEYANSISMTDIRSQWWEGEAVLSKGKFRTLEAIKKARKRFPFWWREIHPDNGSSFINQFLYDYANGNKLKFSRSRPYMKNDNCFVEQKNSRNVRRHVGHVRYDSQREIDILNDLYRGELRLYKNFFQPVMRLELKERFKGHVYRRYEKAKTPYQYLLEDSGLPKEAKIQLKTIYETLNPAELKRSIENKLKLLAEVYERKHSRVSTEIDEATVTFSFDRTAAFRLPSLVT